MFALISLIALILDLVLQTSTKEAVLSLLIVTMDKYMRRMHNLKNMRSMKTFPICLFILSKFLSAASLQSCLF